MDNEYHPVDIAKDAVLFTRSRFGKRYLENLATMRDGYRDKMTNLSLTNEQRANYGVQASTINDVIGYFETAQTIVKDPSLLERLREGFKKRMEGRDKQDV